MDTQRYREMGRKGGATCRDRYGVAFLRQIGREGGEATRAKHGREHLAAIGKKGAARVRELVARGKELEAREDKP